MPCRSTRCSGRCQVVELADPGEAIDRSALEGAGVPPGTERLILKTPNSAALEPRRVHPRLRPPRRQWCFLGRSSGESGWSRIDYLSIGDHDAHVELLGNGVVALEGLDLRGIEPGPYELICLPMRLIGTDGAPARVLLRTSRTRGDG